MNTFVLLALLTFAAQAETSRTPAEPAGLRIPPVLYASHPNWYEGYPVWVSAEAAINEDGTVNRDMVPEIFADTLYNLLNDPTLRVDGCVRLEEVWAERINPPDRSSLPKAVAAADVVVHGEVVEKAHGFQASTAGQLIRVRVKEMVKGEEGLSEYYAFLPLGRFTAGPYKICKTDSRYPSAPDVGDSVLLMPAAVGNLAEPYLHIEEAEGLITLPAKGHALLPRSLEESTRSPQPLDPGHVLDMVRQFANRPAGSE